MQLHLHCKHEMLSKASLATIAFQLVQLIATSAKVTSIGQSVLNSDINLLFSVFCDKTAIQRESSLLKCTDCNILDQYQYRCFKIKTIYN